MLTVIGARPQFIKAAPVSRALKAKGEEVIVHTGQHYDKSMSEIFFSELGIPKPKYNLHVGSASHAVQTAKMLEGLEKIMLDEKPDIVLVYGDTNSTVAAALTSAKLHIPLAHVEGGMRSFDRTMPEEVNRVITDHIAEIHFCSSETAIKNLKDEGVTENVFLVGDVMCEAAVENAKQLDENKYLKQFGLEPGFVVVTSHRPRNTDSKDNMTSIIEALVELADSGETIVFPIHPRTKKKLEEYKLEKKLNHDNIKILPPVGYLEFLALMKASRLVLTDSGGIQKEAFVLKKPCVTMRPATEWVETVEAGWNHIVGADKKKIVDLVKDGKHPADHPKLYEFDGASERIASKLLERVESGR